MYKKPIEILAECMQVGTGTVKIYMEEPTVTPKHAIEAIKIAMKQAWIAGFNDSSFSHSHGFLQQNDEGFDEWLKGLEENK